MNVVCNSLTLVLPGGGGFSLSPQNQKESDLSHLGKLFYILCGHFDEKKIGGSTLPGARVSRQSRWVRGGGGNHLTIEDTRKLKNRHFELVLACMVLKLTVYVKNFISFFYKPKTRWNSDIWKIFSDFFQFCLCFTVFSENRLFLRYGLALWRIVTSYVVRWYLFWYVWKEETLAYTVVPIKHIWGGSVFKITGGGNHPLGKPCYRKRLRKTRVKVHDI